MRQLGEVAQDMRGRRPAVGSQDATTCPKCGDTGWRIEDDGGAGRAVRCECQGVRLGRSRLKSADIPAHYLHCTFAQFNTAHRDPKVQEQLLRARRVCETYVDTFFDPVTQRFRESGLILIGPPGVGKTHLAVATLQELIQRYNVRGRFVDFTTLLHRVQATFDTSNPETAERILRPVIDAEVLVFDELGAQKPTEWVMSQLYLIMNNRYNQRRPTLFTTNYRLEAQDGVDRASLLETRLSPHLVSRLYEMGQAVVLAGVDYRRTVKHHRNRVGG